MQATSRIGKESILAFERRRHILSLIPETGITIAQLAKRLGVASASAQVRLREYMLSGFVHVARAKVDGASASEAWYFTDRDECMAFRERWAQVAKERRKAHDQKGLQKMRDAGISGRHTKPRKKPKKDENRVYTKGTRTPPAKPAAYIEAVNPNGVMPQVIPNKLGNRFDTQQDQSWKLFSACKPGEYPMPASSWADAAAGRAA